MICEEGTAQCFTVPSSYYTLSKFLLESTKLMCYVTLLVMANNNSGCSHIPVLWTSMLHTRQYTNFNAQVANFCDLQLLLRLELWQSCLCIVRDPKQQ